VPPAHLSVDRGSLRDAAVDIDGVAARLESLRTAVDEQAYIPHLAFGLVGEGARHNYAISREDELVNLAAGVRTARTYADDLHRTAGRYLSAEDANVRSVLQHIGWLPGAVSPAPASPAPAAPPSIGSAADLMAVPAVTTLAGAGAAFVAGLGVATAANLKACAGMSALTIGTALAWATVVWSDDGSIDQALRTWDQVAGEARALFGSDVAGVRQALGTVWQGTGATSADGRILEFIIAGMALADRAERRASTLREMINTLVWIHRIAFVISTLMLVATIAALWSFGGSLLAAGAYAPWLTWAVAFIEGLFLSYGMVAMWGVSQEGFALKETASGSAAEAVTAVTPSHSRASRKNQKAPPPFNF
jgi:hypothetical protein